MASSALPVRVIAPRPSVVNRESYPVPATVAGIPTPRRRVRKTRRLEPEEVAGGVVGNVCRNLYAKKTIVVVWTNIGVSTLWRVEETLRSNGSTFCWPLTFTAIASGPCRRPPRRPDRDVHGPWPAGRARPGQRGGWAGTQTGPPRLNASPNTTGHGRNNRRRRITEQPAR